MDTLFKSILFTLMAAFILSAPVFADDFTANLNSITFEASKDRNAFNMEIASEFGISSSKIDQMRFKFGMKDGDIYMACEIAKHARKPLDDVINKYQKNKGKGWGFIAKEMGIKPGSPEFKALKNKTKGKAEKMKQKDHGKGKSEGKGKKK